MSTHVHHVSGRLRVRVPVLKTCQANAAILQSRIGAVRGVTHVECRPLTGSVIVHYRPREADIEAVLALLGCYESLPVLNASVDNNHSCRQSTGLTPNLAGQLAEKVVRAAFGFALEKAAERAFSLFIAAVL